jgi:hypothetical protein
MIATVGTPLMFTLEEFTTSIGNCNKKLLYTSPSASALATVLSVINLDVEGLVPQFTFMATESSLAGTYTFQVTSGSASIANMTNDVVAITIIAVSNC